LEFLNFCETIDENSTVINAEVITKYNGQDNLKLMDVKRTEIIQGETIEEFFTIYNYGSTCDINYSTFEIGDELILNVTDPLPVFSGGNYAGFVLGWCAQDYLERDFYGVFGNISEGKEYEDYEIFKENILACALISNIPTDEEIEASTVIYPNPSFSNVSIISPRLNTTDLEINILGIDGRIVFQRTEEFNGETTINIDNLPSGSYLLQLRYFDQLVIKKIVKY
jgi:hypothetical protein